MNPSPSTALAVLRAWLLVGTLDILAAILNYLRVGGREPVRIFWYIASAVFGRDAAVAGGWLTAGCGLLFHYLIAGCWAALFFAAYPRRPWLGRHWALGGAAYGIVVWLVMNLVVVPLSRAPRIPPTLANVLVGAGILVVCVGLPVAFLAHQHYAKAAG